uniref:FAS1 domain-containing protein n=1 Tax=Pseudo-nitzschia australis TaxID=44445 RepID=A0A7S4EFK9_9STRA|mmetsp:Transcript_20074/g.43683  ORF Transcript_20074/g.43683 Transcript_20074/m.43683 type:complete len:336 (+) Transcript_20074:260-1267(+)
MAIFKNMLSGLILSILVTTGVQAVEPPPGDFGLEDCDAAYPSSNGNKLTTYQILCDQTLDVATNTTTSLAYPVSKKGTAYNTLCSLIGASPAIATYLQSTARHTIFAPTDAAFAKDPLLAQFLLNPAATNSSTELIGAMIQSLMEVHILEGTYLVSDLVCDAVYETLNLYSMEASQQFSKTKCRGLVSKPKQIGGGNTMESEQPTIGVPVDLFSTTEFTSQPTGTLFSRTQTTDGYFSSNVVGCNGVIHAVDNILIGASISGGGFDGSDSKSGKATKAGSPKKAGSSKKTGKKNNLIRKLSSETIASGDRQEHLEKRRLRLEALLQPSGDVQSLK